MTEPNPAEKPLQGWKEISAYLERDMRTAIRWEKEEGLPVRRHRLAGRSSVYAYPSEIEAWRAERPTRSEASPSVPLWRCPFAWAAAAVVAGAAAFIAYGPILNPKAPVAEAAEGSMRAEQVWTGGEADIFNRLSPDGRWMTFPDWSTGDLALRNVATNEARPITGKGSWEKDGSHAEWSAFSPDGKRVAYAWSDAARDTYQLRVGAIQPEGEPHQPVVVFDSPGKQEYVEVFGWLSDSRVLFLHQAEDRTVKLLIADVATKKSSVLKSLGWSYPQGVAISPDGRWIAYGLEPEPLAKQRDVFLLAADGSREIRLVEHPADDAPVTWTRDGSHLLFQSKRSGKEALWALAMADGKAAGPPRLVHPDLAIQQTIGLTPAGELYYQTRTGTRDVYEVEIDAAAGRVLSEPKPIAATVVGDNYNSSYSPDGRSMAYLSARSGRGARTTVIVVRDLASGEEREIDPALSRIAGLSWSPDSAGLLFSGGDRQGRKGIYRIPTEGGEHELLFRPHRPGNFGWMADGRSIHYLSSVGDKGPHRIRDLATGAEREIYPEGLGWAWMSLSPDGTRFAVTDRRGDGKDEIILAAFDVRTGERSDLLTFAGPERAFPANAWSADGKTILFWKMDKSSDKPRRRELWAIDADGGEPRAMGFALDGQRAPGDFSLHPDGRRMTYSTGNPQFEIWKLSNFLSRLEESD